MSILIKTADAVAAGMLLAASALSAAQSRKNRSCSIN